MVTNTARPKSLKIDIVQNNSENTWISGFLCVGSRRFRVSLHDNFTGKLRRHFYAMSIFFLGCILWLQKTQTRTIIACHPRTEISTLIHCLCRNCNDHALWISKFSDWQTWHIFENGHVWGSKIAVSCLNK